MSDGNMKSTIFSEVTLMVKGIILIDMFAYTAIYLFIFKYLYLNVF